MAQSYQSRADDGLNEGEDRIQQLKRKAESVASAVSEEGAKALKSAGQTAETALESTKRFVQAQPLLAIGAVVALAAAAGALWKLAPQQRRNQALLDRVSDYVEPHYRALRRRI